jgi:phage shock protein PspC (stress-responsive transcriptional regulator)
MWIRPANRRVFAGVAQGAADALDISVGWARAIFVLLALFGGLGVPLYLAGWILMPGEGERESIASRWARGIGGDGMRWVGIGLIVAAGIVLLSSTGFVRGGWIWASALLIIGVLLYRGDLETPGRTQPPPIAATEEPAVYGAARPTGSGADSDGAPYSDETVASFAASPYSPVSAPTTDVYAPPAPIPVLPPPPPRSILGRLTLAGVLLTLGVMALLDNLDIARPDAKHYIAAVIAVVGVALVVGAWWGRTRGSIAIGLLLAPTLILTTLVEVPFEGSIGEARFSPETRTEIASPYEHAIGELRIDLRDLDEDAALRAELGIGSLRVIVPADADISVISEIGIGQLEVLGLTRGGLGVDRTVTSSGDGPELVLDLEVGIGELRVERAGF